MTALRLATYNIHTCVGRDGRYDPDRIKAVLDEIDADVVALQEVSAQPRDHLIPDQFTFFEKATGFACVAGANVIAGRSRYGNALLSRYPIDAVEQIDLSVAPHERRGAIAAVLRTGTTSLRVIATHLGLRRRERAWQIKHIARHIAEAVPASPKVPTIVMGDLNCWGPGAARLLRPLVETQPATRVPWSFPSIFPLVTLDRIEVRGPARLDDLRAHTSPLARRASDHLPVTARLIRDPGIETPGTRPGV